MGLKNDWKAIVRHAWSIRLMVLAGLLSAVEVVLPLYSDALPRGLFAVLSIVAVGGGFVARLVAQKAISDAE